MHVQLALLVAGVFGGLLVGLAAPGVGDALAPATWPVLAAVLYATFLQVELRTLPEALRHRRFLVTALVANFALVPLAVGVAVLALPLDRAVALGILLVLLAPCTDWFVSFTQLGGGDTRLAVAFTPVLLAAQIVFLPLYVWVLSDVVLTWGQIAPLVLALVLVILSPFALAVLTQRYVGRSTVPGRFATKWVVPLLGVTLFLVAAAEASLAWDARGELGVAVLVFVAYACVAAPLARGMAGVARLDSGAARTLAFNLGTRNSFVVLPLALTLPAEYAVAASVVAAQTLVELVAMVVYVRWVPRLLPARAPSETG